MTAKARLTVFAVAVLFPLFIVCINIKAFWLATAFLMVGFSIGALKELLIVNFASDAFYEKHIAPKSKSDSVALILTDIILICGAYGLILIMLFMSSFILQSYAMKIFALVLLALWAFDFHKVFYKEPEAGEWSYKDTLKEIVMWLQSSLSIVFVMISLFLI